MRPPAPTPFPTLCPLRPPNPKSCVRPCLESGDRLLVHNYIDYISSVLVSSLLLTCCHAISPVATHAYNDTIMPYAVAVILNWSNPYMEMIIFNVHAFKYYMYSYNIQHLHFNFLIHNVYHVSKNNTIIK